MRQLILLYWGCDFLMYLSQVYYPTPAQLEGPQTGRRHFMLCKADIFMIVVIVWMTCFSFLRTNYNDTANYIFFWRTAASTSDFLAGGGLLDLTGNPLSMFWQSFSHIIAENYHVYFLPPALLSSFAVVKLLKRYAVSPSFSLLIFFSIGTYIMYMAALKQCFAMFFLLLSIPYAEEKICAVLSSCCNSNPFPYSCVHVCNFTVLIWKTVGKSDMDRVCCRAACNGNL